MGSPWEYIRYTGSKYTSITYTGRYVSTCVRDTFSRHRRIFRIIWLDEPDQPVSAALVCHRGKWCDDVDPRPARVQRDKIALCVDEVHRAHQASLLFPGTILRRPVDLERLPITE